MVTTMPKQTSKKISRLIIFLNVDGVALRTVIVLFLGRDATLDDLNTELLVTLFEGLMTDTTFAVGVHAIWNTISPVLSEMK